MKKMQIFTRHRMRHGNRLYTDNFTSPFKGYSTTFDSTGSQILKAEPKDTSDDDILAFTGGIVARSGRKREIHLPRFQGGSDPVSSSTSNRALSTTPQALPARASEEPKDTAGDDGSLAHRRRLGNGTPSPPR